eukprot:c683_g1_i1 orf=383-742(+)
MQLRTGVLAVAEEAGLIGRELAKSQAIKREWPLKLARRLLLFIILGGAVICGVASSLHLFGYWTLGGYISWWNVSSRAEVNPPLNLEDWLTGYSIHHYMSDQELLWLASMVPKRQDSPP